MLNSNQLSHFRERQAASLMDTCHKLVYSRVFNDYNEPIEFWTENNTDIPCGLEQKQGEERSRDKDTIVSYDAIVRLPLSENWNEKDRIRIIKRFGEDITPFDYGIISPIQRGPSGIRMLLNKILIEEAVHAVEIFPQGNIIELSPIFKWDDDDPNNFTDYFVEVTLAPANTVPVISHWFGPNTNPGDDNYPVRGDAPHKNVQFPFVFSLNVDYSWRWLGWHPTNGYGLWSDYYYFTRVA